MLQREGKRAGILKAGRWLYSCASFDGTQQKTVFLVPAKAVVKTCALFLRSIPTVKDKQLHPMMKRTITIAFLVVYPACLVVAQIDEKLNEEVRESGYVHSPLPVEYGKSFEAFGLTGKMLVSAMLCTMEDMAKESHEGMGGM